MTLETSKLRENLIVAKIGTMKDSIYEAIKELPFSQFGTIIAMVTVEWCEHNGIDAPWYLNKLSESVAGNIDTVSDAVEDDGDNPH